MTRVDRKAFLRTTLAAGTLSAALRAPLRAADLVKVRVSVIPILDTAPFYAAQKQGYFTDAGLDVGTDTETTGQVGISALIAGAYEVAYSNTPSAIAAIQQGLDLRVIAEGEVSVGPPDTTALIVRKGESLKRGKDLEGKTIAVSGIRNVQWIFARSWVKATGGNPELVIFREVPFPEMGDALKNKRVDAIFAIDPFMSAILTDPAMEVIGYPFSTVLPNSRPAVWLVTGDYARKNRAVVQKFLSAFERGVQWVNANAGKEPMLKLAAAFTHIDEARLATMRMPAAAGGVDVRQLQRMVDIMRDNGLPVDHVNVAAVVFR